MAIPFGRRTHRLAARPVEEGEDGEEWKRDILESKVACFVLDSENEAWCGAWTPGHLVGLSM